MTRAHKLVSMVTLALGTSATQAASITNFEDLVLAPNSFYNGGPVTNTSGWTSNGVHFGNSYNSDWGGFWNGFSYSNVNDTTTPGFMNQYAAYTGTAFSGSIYAVAYAGSHAYINLPTGYTPASVRVTNTTYAALDMLWGSFFSKKFGGPSGDDPDFFDVIFTGYAAANATGSTTGSVSFRLADYTFADNTQDYIVNSWQLVDLSPLGGAVSIKVSFASSDVGPWGMNTPAYVAIDDLTLVPEPTSALLLALTGAAMVLRRRTAL